MDEKQAEVQRKGALALIAQADGKTLTRPQASNLRDFKEQFSDYLFRNCSKALYQALSGRQRTQVNRQGEKHGIPIEGATVDLYAVIKAFHDFLSANGKTLGDIEDLKKEKMRLEISTLSKKEKMLENDMKSKDADYVVRAEVRGRLQWLSQRLQKLGEVIGNESADMQSRVNDFLEELAEEIDKGHLEF